MKNTRRQCLIKHMTTIKSKGLIKKAKDIIKKSKKSIKRLRYMQNNLVKATLEIFLHIS